MLWDSRGTGSDHIMLKDKVVSAANFFDPMNSQPWMPGPLYHNTAQFVRSRTTQPPWVAGGALDDLVRPANTERQQQNTAAPVRDLEKFQYELGRIGPT
jgi:indole-3-acetate monooxygenase